MKKQGSRCLIVPPAWAYGAAGAPPSIPPNATLVIEMSVAKIRPANAGAGGEGDEGAAVATSTTAAPTTTAASFVPCDSYTGTLAWSCFTNLVNLSYLCDV